jgi:hypothetical protein
MSDKHPIVQGLILAAIVGIVTAVVNVLTTSVSKADLMHALKTHGAHPHGPAAERLRALEAADGTQNAKLAKLDAVERDVREVRARIDVLLLRELDSPRGGARIRRAAAKVRSDARERGEPGDPLAGLSEDL